jgi:hypothetical protein
MVTHVAVRKVEKLEAIDLVLCLHFLGTRKDYIWQLDYHARRWVNIFPIDGLFHNHTHQSVEGA